MTIHRRRFLTGLGALLAAPAIIRPAGAAFWVEGSRIGIADAASESPFGLYVNTLWPQSVAQYPMATMMPGTSVPTSESWIVMDTSLWAIPADVIAVQLTGIMAITMGSAAETADLHVYLGRPDNPGNDYIMQTLAVPASQGARTNGQSWVRTVGNKFKFAWWCASPQPFVYPDHACYAINIKPQAYVRP